MDSALRAVIEREAVHASGVEIVFDAPTKDWAARRTMPTVDVYLYDIREDLRRRERGLINEYDGTRVQSRHLPPRYFKLSYLVTAWTQRPEDEHRLLASLLSCFLRHDALPRDVLTGMLADLGLPVPVTIALPPPEDRSFADVWSALGGELKPSLDIVVSAPTATGQVYLAGPPVQEPTAFVLGGRAGSSGSEFGDWPPPERRGGRTAVQARMRDAAHRDSLREQESGAGSPDPGAAGVPSQDRPAGSRSAGGRSAGGPPAGMTWAGLARSGAPAVSGGPEVSEGEDLGKSEPPAAAGRRRVQAEQRPTGGGSAKGQRSAKPRSP